MGIKLDLNDLHTLEHIRSTPRQAAKTAAPLQGPAVAAGLSVLLVLLIVMLSPIHVTVQGRPEVLPRRVTVAQAAAALGLPAVSGNLVDVTGQVLRAGAGRPPLFLVNGEVVAPGTRLHNHAALACVPGIDIVEPAHEHAVLTSAVTPSGVAVPAVVGTRRFALGTISGKQVLEVTPAVATVPAPPVTGRPRLIALTFDDGPHPTQTPQILAILRKHHAHATFFVLGMLAQYHPALVRQEAEDGNEVGLHTWNHENLSHLSAHAITANLTKTQAQVQALVGKPIRLVRPPYGSLNASAAAVVRGLGYRIVLWSVDTNDWRRPGADAIYSRLLHGARTGAIILCHDGGGPRSQTIAALARAVPALQQRGYEFATVSQVLGLHAQPQGGALLAAGQRFEVKAVEPGLAVSLDEEPLPLTETPVEVNGQLLLPLRPLVDELGVKWEWNQAAQKLTLRGPLETLTLRLNSTKLERQYGAPETLPAPPVLYRGALMVPVWVMMQVSGATALYDDEARMLRLISFDRGLRSAKLGQGPPRSWGKDVKWREYLRDGR